MYQRPLRSAALTLAAVFALSTAARCEDLPPISYIVKIADPASHTATITATIPTDWKFNFDLMMPVWSPGFYRVEDYAAKVKILTCKGADARDVPITQTAKNRWHVQTTGDVPAPCILLTYELTCDGRSVTTNAITPDYAIINPGAAFITLAENQQRPYVVELQLPPQWKQSISSLGAPPDGHADHYLAPDYDTLVDSPIVAGGNLSIHDFTVGESHHYLVDFGDMGSWNGAAAAAKLEKIARANQALWSAGGGVGWPGGLPFKKYVFLNAFRAGGGGLEHLNSTLLTSSSGRGQGRGRGAGTQTASAPAAPVASAPAAPPGGDLRWLAFVSHEYFHAFNVKRIRPVELGPFDYTKNPITPSLWISEGLTVYYENIILARAGLASQTDLLNSVSSTIRAVQNSPGHLKQTLNDASLNVWTQSNSGIGGNAANTVSYYDKGAVVGFLLDAKLRHMTNGQKSLDDLMRAAMKTYGPPNRGFKPEEFVALAEQAATVVPTAHPVIPPPPTEAPVTADLKPWFHSVLGTTEELDYREALEWYGLRFAPTPPAAAEGGAASAPARGAFTLEPLLDASEAQKAHLRALMIGN